MHRNRKTPRSTGLLHVISAAAWTLLSAAAIHACTQDGTPDVNTTDEALKGGIPANAHGKGRGGAAIAGTGGSARTDARNATRNDDRDAAANDDCESDTAINGQPAMHGKGKSAAARNGQSAMHGKGKAGAQGKGASMSSAAGADAEDDESADDADDQNENSDEQP